MGDPKEAAAYEEMLETGAPWGTASCEEPGDGSIAGGGWTRQRTEESKCSSGQSAGSESPWTVADFEGEGHGSRGSCAPAAHVFCRMQSAVAWPTPHLKQVAVRPAVGRLKTPYRAQRGVL